MSSSGKNDWLGKKEQGKGYIYWRPASTPEIQSIKKLPLILRLEGVNLHRGE